MTNVLCENKYFLISTLIYTIYTTRRGSEGTRREMELRQRNERRESDIEVVRMMPAPGCIDLTSEVDEEFVDLTSLNDSSVVVINSPATPHPRSTGKLGRGHDSTLRDDEPGTVQPQQTNKTAQKSGGGATLPASPHNHIICPICLDHVEEVSMVVSVMFTDTCTVQ
ncbi:hypothetical protein LSAT2_025120 [Lamellibrachia satsuma]|nr:hypothetical protein LSAT2_025120 [Lamellibrachia satsuma]